MDFDANRPPAKPPYLFLQEFYASRGIKQDDLEGKLRVMRGVVMTDDLQPSLSELETVYLEEKGYKL